MPYKIAIASGKGGTGKTTLALSIFHFLGSISNEKLCLVDCDVEEPNDLLFLPGIKKTGSIEVSKTVAQIDTSLCTFCRKCVEYCGFNAIVVLPPAGFAEVNREMCHSCSACLAACNDNAIVEIPEKIGDIALFITPGNSLVAEGKLKVGSAMQTMLIRELKRNIPPGPEIMIFDSPPGTSCPVVTTISGSDLVILVAEPTPFGLHDLEIMVSLLEELKLSFGVVINKAGIGNDNLYNYLREKEIGILGELPFDRTFAGAYASGKLFDEMPGIIKKSLEELASKLIERIRRHEGNIHS